jgi:hypothetical protein
MKLNIILLFLFLICSILCVIGSVFENETLFLVAKTMVFPTIIFYYFDQTQKINYLFVLSLFLFYLADVFIILDLKYLNLLLGISLNISHIILLRFVFQDLDKTKKSEKIFWLSVLVFLIVQGSHVAIFIFMYESNFVLANIIFISAIILSTICSIGFYNYCFTKSKSNFYFMITCICFVFMYLSFHVYKYIHFVAILKYLSLICKLASYFFVVKYMIYRNDKKDSETIEIVN